jgi:2-dehydro-3-deoxygluconokinase
MDILAMGEPLLEFNAGTEARGPVGASDAFTVGYGGDTSNFLVAAQRSGARTGYLTRIGDALVGLWRRENVDTRHVVREAGGRTGIYFISRTQAQSRFTYYRADSPATRLTAGDVPEDAVADARLLHLTGITQAISNSACDAAFRAMDVARSSGTLISYDPNHRAALWPAERARAVVLRSLELCDIALPNLAEGRMLTGADEPEDVLDALVRRGPSIVVLKMGEEGALLSHRGETSRIAPYAVDAVDPSGAGDTFNGAFAARLLDGEKPAQAARYAAVAAALTTTRAGAVLPIPSRATIDAVLSGDRGQPPVMES